MFSNKRKLWMNKTFSKTYSGVVHLDPAGQAVQFVCFVRVSVVCPRRHLEGLSVVVGHICPDGQSVQFA